MTQQGSPYTPPGHRSKTGSRYRNRGVVSTIGSNVVLTTLGSIHPDHMDIDIERDVVEMEEIRLGLGMDLGNLSTAIGGDDGEPLPEGEGHRGRRRGSPAPAYYSLEMGFRSNRERSPSPSVAAQSIAHSVAEGIRIDVEQATSS
jgi:hypothetical protein